VHLAGWTIGTVELVIEREDGVEMRERLLTIGRADLTPPDVDVFLGSGASAMRGDRGAKEVESRVEGVGSVGRIPDGEEVVGGDGCGQ